MTPPPPFINIEGGGILTHLTSKNIKTFRFTILDTLCTQYAYNGINKVLNHVSDTEAKYVYGDINRHLWKDR